MFHYFNESWQCEYDQQLAKPQFDLFLSFNFEGVYENDGRATLKSITFFLLFLQMLPDNLGAVSYIVCKELPYIHTLNGSYKIILPCVG